ncbi:MAG: helix-turn-helix transcriptional regulator [Clostridia bacterium]|nr:helix-turn-helix transcriptional regulator [Clostridia bacterium]
MQRANAFNKREYIYSNETGDAELISYQIFPGIQVVYNSVHMDRFDLSIPTRTGHFIEIHHCREGRIEQEFGNDFFYLMPGDLSVAKRDRMAQAYNFPLRHYHGITIAIDTEVATGCFSAYMEDVKVQPSAVAKRLCGERACAVLRSEPYIEHIFSEMYTIREEMRYGYLKIKILELFFMLNIIDPPVSDTTGRALPKAQVSLAKQAAAYLARNMDKRITVAELAKRFAVSETFLKGAFKGVYGVAVFTYVRIQKMQCAAQLLISTDRSVADISNEFGYSNESKFSAAFKEIMGDTPGVFRRMHSKIHIV